MHAIKKAFKAAAKRAGLERVSPYCLRHTMATELRARGVPEWETMVFLVHKSQARTTERYARFRPDYLGHAAKAIDAYFAELRQQFGRLLPDQIFNPVRATSVPVPKVEFPQELGNDGGRYWDRTSDPCDVKAGVIAQLTDFSAHGRAADLCLRHERALYVLARWFNEPKSTVLRRLVGPSFGLGRIQHSGSSA